MNASPVSSILRVVIEAFRRLVSFLLLISTTIVATLVILANIITNTLNQSPTWLQALEETQFMDRGRPLISTILLSTYVSGFGNTINQSTSTADWESIAQTIIPAQWLDENIQYLIHQSIVWLTSPDMPLPEINIDLTPLKGNIRSPKGSAAFLPLLEDVPPCETGVNVIVYMSGSLINCLPKQWDRVYVAQEVSSIIADALPDQISISVISSSFEGDSQIIQSIYRIKTLYTLWVSTIEVGFQISVLLLCLYLLLESKSVINFVRAFPRPFYAVGIMLLILLAAWYILQQWGSGLLIPVVLKNWSLENKAMIADLVRSIGTQNQEVWLIWGLGLVFFALLIQLIGYQFTKGIRRHSMVEEKSTKPRKSVRKQFY